MERFISSPQTLILLLGFAYLLHANGDEITSTFNGRKKGKFGDIIYRKRYYSKTVISMMTIIGMMVITVFILAIKKELIHNMIISMNYVLWLVVMLITTTKSRVITTNGFGFMNIIGYHADHFTNWESVSKIEYYNQLDCICFFCYKDQQVSKEYLFCSNNSEALKIIDFLKEKKNLIVNAIPLM